MNWSSWLELKKRSRVFFFGAMEKKYVFKVCNVWFLNYFPFYVELNFSLGSSFIWVTQELSLLPFFSKLNSNANWCPDSSLHHSDLLQTVVTHSKAHDLWLVWCVRTECPTVKTFSDHQCCCWIKCLKVQIFFFWSTSISRVLSCFLSPKEEPCLLDTIMTTSLCKNVGKFAQLLYKCQYGSSSHERAQNTQMVAEKYGHNAHATK